MNSRDLTKWQAWERVNGPLGAERGDWRAAMQAQVLAEINRDTQHRRQPFRLLDFMLWKKREPRGITDPKQMLEVFRGLFPGAGERK